LITFKYARWKNFLSTGNTFTEIQLDRNPSTLIIGENGAGKSTILDALCFGLFGKPFRQISKNQLINTVNGQGTVVEIEFETQNKQCKVVRGIKPNTFEIWVDGNMINQSANARDYQKHLEQQILKLNYRSFTQVVILGSSTFIPFMQLKSQARREVVEDILDIKIFSLMNLILKGKVKSLNTDISENKYQADLHKEKVELQEKYIEDIERNKDTLLSQKTTLRDGNEEEVFTRNAEVKRITEENQTLLDAMSSEDKAIEKRDKLKDIQFTLKDKQVRHERMITFMQENDDCPTCEQSISEDFKAKTISQRTEQVNELTTGLLQMKTEMDKANGKLKEFKDIAKVINDNSIKLAKLNSGITELEKFNATLIEEIRQIESGDVTKTDYEKLDNLKKMCYSLDSTKSKLKEDMLYYDVAKNLLQDTGIKTKIIKQYLPIMNKLINTYLSSMDFFVNFNIDENFNETIKSRFRDVFSYANFSEGEKMRIDLALLFTWRAIAKMKNSTNTNLLILDEIFDSSLDATGTDDFLKILNTFDKENVFIISHKQDMLIDKFRSVVKFEKVKNFSKVA
jgi:DNA repair exonuclease SbcCD ATPase subunit|tara:strand:+ start:1358 stop:3064 length:1707 start_codon:yes stop_codon:yes gene_type:complete